MNVRYLLAAEADKIQDFVFRAARLRQVTGGSALLTRFCAEVPDKCLGLYDDQIIVSDGGAFRLLFPDAKSAVAAGRELADLYYMATGCSLSVADPVALDASGFGNANEQAGLLLRAAKLNRSPRAEAHLPYMAFCASTGVELAADFRPAKGGATANYLSLASEYKRRETGASGKEAFINEFIQSVIGSDRSPDEFSAIEEAGQVGRAGGYDQRDYVAYLVADGNGMGMLFGRCKHADDARKLSLGFSDVARMSLAAPTQRLMVYQDPRRDERLIPVLPLILGGDDLFALLPAPYALSFAQEFCRAFEAGMETLIAGIPGLAGAPKPTMAAAVVICKAKYPFQLAFQRGRALLKEAKRLCKSDSAVRRSAVSFEVVIGSRLEGADRSGTSDNVRSTLRPYWADAIDTDLRSALPLQRLLNARYGLRSFPQKRQAQLRRHFETPDLRSEQWSTDLRKLLERIISTTADDEESSEAHRLRQVMADLGDPRSHHYYRTVRRGPASFKGNAMPDLFDAWDFLYDLDYSPAEYEVNHD